MTMLVVIISKLVCLLQTRCWGC